MKTLSKPDIDVCNIITTCVDNYRKQDLKNKFLSNLDNFSQSAKKYDDLANNGELHTICTLDNCFSLSDLELKNLYTYKFSKRGQKGRQYYDKIKAAAGTCPYCIVREVSQLDHVLPKSEYPAYAVLPYNMVPSCRDCNENKGALQISKNKDLHLHPYYDKKIEINDYWLYANIIQGSELQVNYTIKKPNATGWDNDFWERVSKHFELFKLNKSYSFHASIYINGEKTRWKRLKDSGGSSELRQHLLEHNNDLKVSCGWNHWKTVLFFALANSDWFLNTYIP